MNFRKAVVFSVLFCMVQHIYAVTVKDVIAKGKNPQKLFDGKTADSSYWSAVGEHQNIDIFFDSRERICRMRIYPGIRAFASYPSTEAGPREIALYYQKDGKFVKLSEKNITLPRDPQKGNDFFCDIDFEQIETSAIRLEIIASHDMGFRRHSLTKSVVLPEKRALNVREIKFFTVDEIAREKAEIRNKFMKAALFLEKYDNFASENSAESKIITEFWGKRIENLRNELDKGINAEKIIKESDYLISHVTPYFTLKNNYKNGQAAFSVRIANSVAAGTPVEFPMYFNIFEKMIGKKVSHFNVSVEAVSNGKNVSLRSNLMPLTPNRAVLCWNTVKDADEYHILLNNPAAGETPLMQSAIGNGDQIMLNQIGKSGMSWRVWNVRSGDLFNDGKMALLTGMWTDYAHIYRNIGTVEKPLFHEGAHYFARDPYDEKIGTTHHHALGFSLVETADLSGDGKLDVVLSRTYNNTPIFAENISADADSMDFNHPIEINSLASGYRYSYGDLDGDNIADAVGISVDMKNGKITLLFCKGLGLDRKGAPVFAKPVPMNLNIPDSKETSRAVDSMFPSVCIADLNNDDLADLGISVPADIYVSFNEGTAEKFKFTRVEQVKSKNGKVVQNEFFFPNIGFFDVNGDGVKDLFTRTASWSYISQGDIRTVADKSTYNGWLEGQKTLDGSYFGLAHFVMDDFDNDGFIEFCQENNNNQLNVFRMEDGKFSKVTTFNLKNNSVQRFGCCDTTEYGGSYSQITMADFDGDGFKDVLINNEHNWRFGYYSLYLNDGKGGLKEEIKIVPKPETRHLQLVNSPDGKALKVDPDTILDYLSFDCRKFAGEKNGVIEFTFAADSDKIPALGRTFFSSWFWNTKKYNAQQLFNLYRTVKDMKTYLDKTAPFALLQMPDGKIRCQLGDHFCESAPVKLAAGKYHKFAVKWNENGVKVYMDGKVIASSNARVPAFAERLHLGSMVWMAIQHAREYPDRRKSHPVDFSAPACGYFENFKLFDGAGEESLKLDFENSFGDLKERTAIVYRCAPAVIENYNGKAALIVECDDMYREEIPGNPKARINIIPFEKVKGKAPVFGKAVPVNYTDGKPFYANSRTNIALYDWDKDGDTDIVLATENNNGAKYNDCIELYHNDGKWNFTRANHPVFKKLNELLTPHHDIKLQFVKLTGNAEPDMAIWTDPGFRVYSINYLTQDKPVPVCGEIFGKKYEEFFDIEYNAADGKLPVEYGFSLKEYQTSDPAAGGYAGIREVDGRKVLFLDHADSNRRWNAFIYKAPEASWKSMTIECKFRLTGESDKPQFYIGATFKDPSRKFKNSYISASFGKKCVAIPNAVPFDFGDTFRTVRIVIDREKSNYKVYDLDNGNKVIGEFVLITGPAAAKPCTVSFGDGSSAVEGSVEMEYIKIAFDKKYIPNNN